MAKYIYSPNKQISMSNDAIKQRLLKIGDKINEKLDQHGYRCHGVTIKMTEWCDKVSLDVFNDDEQINISFDIAVGIRDDGAKPCDYLEEITMIS